MPRARIDDRLVLPAATTFVFDDARIDTRHTHGTGCTLSSAIATLLGKGLPLSEAVVARANSCVLPARRAGLRLGPRPAGAPGGP